MTDQMPSSRASKLQLSNLIAGVVIGGLLVGAIAPLVGSDGGGNVSSTESPGFLAGEDASGGDRSSAGAGAVDADDDVLGESGVAGGGGANDGTGGSVASGPGGGTSATGTPAAGPLTASDVGVTPEVIRVGSMTLNLKAGAALGVSGFDNTPHGPIAQAFVDDINRRGGINGRKLELYTAEYDPIEDAVNGGGTERAACLDLTQRRKVFAVVVGAVFANACIYDENKTTLLTPGDVPAEDPDTFNRSDGRLWLLNASSGRTLLDWARQIDRQQLFSKSTKFGIVFLDGPHRKQIERYLLPELARLGYTPAHLAILPNDAAALPVKTASEVPAMRGKGVTHVLMAADYVAAQTWIRESQRNGWKPQYLQSDFPSGAHDYQGDQNAGAGDWTGAIAVSTYPEGTYDQTRADPVSKRCLDIYERTSGKRTSEPLSGWVQNFCTLYGVFERAAKAAGPNLTRQTLAQALATMGEFPYAGAHGGIGRFGGRYLLGPVRWTAADTAQRKVWRAPCPRPQDGESQRLGCYVPDSAPYRMAA